ncbi:MAG: AAA family ATPase [Planctomycetales bacterium]|nr:AAA family ATPase [Planctomycetales bacterium]
MEWIYAAVGVALGVAGTRFLAWRRARGQAASRYIPALLAWHFHPLSFDKLVISQRQFPYRMRADLQRVIEKLFADEIRVVDFCGLRREYGHEGLTLADCIVENQHNPTTAVPPEYEELDIGEERPLRVLTSGLWLLEQDGVRIAMLLAPVTRYGRVTGMQFQLAAPGTSAGAGFVEHLFQRLQESVHTAESYRGKILSLEESEHAYSGEATGIKVHQLRLVEREQVILPQATLSLLDRNVIQFVRQREQLARFGQPTKKGLLFYGPPGTGKTHTIHYLARALPAHTTLLIAAEQVAILGEYMTLARLLQPSIVVIEDVDLIARDRAEMSSACEEVLLNKLLNEMDGLKQDADILFLLTTNRPEALEAALASRPGRIDQAIEFPLPDEDGRRKLIELYCPRAQVATAELDELVRRTEGVSAAFIKELMRRVIQYHIEANGDGQISRSDVDHALDEMLFRGGTLNLKLLGASQPASEEVEG